MSMKIYLVRHGETDWNKERRLQGATDAPLNAYGKELAAITAKALEQIPFNVAFCSPLSRARETAKIIIGNRDIFLREDARLREISFGVKEGCSIPEAKETPDHPIYHFFHHPECFVPAEGGESFEDVRRRTGEFMKECILPLENQYDTVLIVAHGVANRCILNPLLGIPIEEFWKIYLNNCAVSVLSLENGVFRVLEEAKLYY